MPWASVAAAGVSALGGIFGSKKAPKRNAAKEMRAQFVANNPDISNPFGYTRTKIDDKGTTRGKWHMEDDTYSIEQGMSPQMQALADMLMSRAGASRGTFSSGGMPEALKQRYAQSAYQQSLSPEQRQAMAQGLREQYQSMTGTGGGGGAPRPAGAGMPSMPKDLSAYMPSQSTYQRPEFGFGGGDGPAAVSEEDMADYMATQYLPDGATNQEALDWLRNNGGLSGSGLDAKEADWLQEHFNTGAGGGRWMNRGTDWIAGTDFNDKNKGRVRDFMAALDQYRAPGGEPYDPGLDPNGPRTVQPQPVGPAVPIANMDPVATQRLVNSLMGMRS